MFGAFVWSDLIPSLMSFVVGGGLVAAYSAWYKVKPEAGQIVVTAAEGALIVQTGVIDNQNKEIKRLSEAVAARDQKIDHLEEQVRLLELELHALKLKLGDCGSK